MSPENNSATQFGDIALCLSGGGYRAAAFHLGTLSMLDELDLLANVKMISTVSGGTIVGASYAVWRTEQEEKGEDKEKFSVFADEFKTSLKEINVIKNALENISTKRSIDSKGKTSVINEAANVYYKHLPFVKGKNFGCLFDENNKVKAPFKELVFNATEFKKGSSFRFVASNNNRLIGNKFLKIDKEDAKKVRLADIVAASSCFPGGFEPIVFPDDFVGMKEVLPNFESVALMDGGVYDNQGIMSQLNYKPHIEATELFIISDVSARPDQMLEHYEEWNSNNSFISKIINFSLWKMLAVISAIGFLLSLVYGIFLIIQTYAFFNENVFNLVNFLWATAVYFLPIIFSICIFLLSTFVLAFTAFPKNVGKLLKKITIIKNFIPEVMSAVTKLTIRDLVNLIKPRLESLIKMSSNVFMDRIRDLQNDFIMKNSKLRNKVAFNSIYAIDERGTKERFIGKHPELEPTQTMMDKSKTAEDVGTILWLDDKKDLNNLVLCGEMTICFSLLEYLMKAKNLTENENTDLYEKYYQKVRKRWLKFIQDTP